MRWVEEVERRSQVGIDRCAIREKRVSIEVSISSISGRKVAMSMKAGRKLEVR